MKAKVTAWFSDGRSRIVYGRDPDDAFAVAIDLDPLPSSISKADGSVWERQELPPEFNIPDWLCDAWVKVKS